MTTKYEPECEWLRGTGRYMCYPKFLDGGGVYVDLGCSHPTNKSLTSFVRDLGWSGLAIDGNHDYQKDWDATPFASHFCCAILSDQPRARFAIHDNSFTSRLAEHGEEHPEKWGITRIVEENVQPLNEILAAHGIGKIDLLCVDLEGMEAKVLATLDWEKHAPAFVISEYVTAGTGVDPGVFNLLVPMGYEAIFMTESNIIYHRK